MLYPSHLNKFGHFLPLCRLLSGTAVVIYLEDLGVAILIDELH